MGHRTPPRLLIEGMWFFVEGEAIAKAAEARAAVYMARAQHYEQRLQEVLLDREGAIQASLPTRQLDSDLSLIEDTMLAQQKTAESHALVARTINREATYQLDWHGMSQALMVADFSEKRFKAPPGDGAEDSGWAPSHKRVI